MGVQGTDALIIERGGVLYKATAAQLAALASAGAPAFSTVEIDLGSVPRRTGSFTIAGAGLTVGKPVMISQAAGPYTGKGTRADEAEADVVLATGVVTAANTITGYWSSPYPVRGNFKFNYLVGA